MNVSNMQEHRDAVAAIAADFGIDMGWVLIDAVGDVQIGMDANGVDTKVERLADGLWGVFRHEQPNHETVRFETALRWALKPLCDEGLYKVFPTSV